jgi:hypothetical protein
MYSPNFTARNKIIRDADKICRAVNSRFPHISPTYRTREIASNILNLIEEYENGFKNTPLAAQKKYKKYEKLVESYITAGNQLENTRSKRVVYNGLSDYVSKLIVSLRKDQLANCAELSEIAFLMCKNKKFDDVKIFSLEAFEKFNAKNPTHKNLVKAGCDIESVSVVDLDHVAVSFRHKNKTVVVDPWLGISDFAENYKTKIKTLYKNFFLDLKDNYSIRLQNFDNELDTNKQCELDAIFKKYRSLNVEL